MQILKLVSAVSFGILLTSCITRTIYVDPPPLSLPDKPELVKFKQSELVCSDGRVLDTAIKILIRQRDNQHKKYEGKLEAKLLSTHKKVD